MKVRRTFLVRMVQEYEVPELVSETPESLGFGDFDQYVCDSGTLLSEDYETIDNDQRHVRVVS